jgi:hypothetical protein
MKPSKKIIKKRKNHQQQASKEMGKSNAIYCRKRRTRKKRGDFRGVGSNFGALELPNLKSFHQKPQF